MISPKFKQYLSKANKLIGFILFIICAIAIYNKVATNENIQQHGEDLRIQVLRIGYLEWAVLFFLMLFNYLFESIKWKLVVASTNKLSILNSIRSVFVGQAFSFFTPARVGDYVGRTLFLNPGTKLQGLAQMAWASYAQVLNTLTMGTIALFFNLPFLVWLKWVAPFACIAAYCIFFYSKPFKGWMANLNLIQIPTSLKWQLLGVAFLRYAIFIIQYTWVTKMLGISIELLPLWTSVAVLFLCLSLIPSISLTDLVIRGQLFTLLLAPWYSNDLMLIVLSTFIWAANFLIPSIIGAFLLLGFRLKQ